MRLYYWRLNKLAKANNRKLIDTIELALAATQKKDTVGQCLTVDHMKSLVNNKKSKEFQVALAHFNTCSDCLDLWVKISLHKEKFENYKNYIQDEDVIEKEDLQKTKVTFVLFLWAYFAVWIRKLNHKKLIVTGIVGCFIFSFFWFYESTDINILINNSSHHLLSQNLPIEKDPFIVSINPINLGKGTKGISEKVVDSSESQSLIAGILIGRQTLLNKDTSIINEYVKAKESEVYFSIGKWSLIISIACLADLDISFWKQQHDIFIQLFELLEQVENKNEIYHTVYEKFDIAKPYMEKLKHEIIDIEQRNKIKEIFESLILDVLDIKK